MPEIDSPSTPASPFPLAARRDPASSKAMVIIHGAGHFVETYHQPVVTAIEEMLGKPINYAAVLYAQFTDPSLMAAAVSAMANASPVAAKIQADFQNELVRDALIRAIGAATGADLLRGIAGVPLPPGADLFSILSAQLQSADSAKLQSIFGSALSRILPAVPLKEWLGKITNAPPQGTLDARWTVQGVYYYLFNDRVRSDVQGCLARVLDEAVQTYDEIILVSHSLGTVVAFDVLKQNADRYGKISTWFTLGCPLAKLAKVSAHFQDLGKIMNRTIGRWYNVYDTTDIVANALGPAIAKSDCPIFDIFIDIGKDPLPSHDYFANRETLSLVAETLR